MAFWKWWPLADLNCGPTDYETKTPSVRSVTPWTPMNKNIKTKLYLSSTY